MSFMEIGRSALIYRNSENFWRHDTTLLEYSEYHLGSRPHKAAAKTISDGVG